MLLVAETIVFRRATRSSSAIAEQTERVENTMKQSLSEGVDVRGWAGGRYDLLLCF